MEHERRCLDDLSASADWLIGHEWYIERGLVVEAVIRAHGHGYTLRLTFPSMFPDAPPVVRPVGESQRLSDHQYGGADGPLCLQWGPDNWHPQVTAAEMLRSSHELLEAEDPAGGNLDAPQIPVPSRHHLTLGQQVRNANLRWYVRGDLVAFLASRPTGDHGLFDWSLRNLQSSFGCLVHSLRQPNGDEVWADQAIPANLPGAEPSRRLTGVWVNAGLEYEVLRSAETLAALRTLLADAGVLPLDSPVWEPSSGVEPDVSRDVLLTDSQGRCHLLLALTDGKLSECACISSGPEANAQRAPLSAFLRGKSIAVVGLGSAGSKIALSLARMGVGRFYLVDYDLMLPENLQRHALDWQAVTQHKADAVARALGFIDPSIAVQTSDVHLTGQESNAYLNAVLKKIGDCDLLIDATAEPRVFNLLAGVAGAVSRPLAWLEVFGGGIGGLVARSRPGADPTPHDMRAAYLSYCQVYPAPQEIVSTTDYTIQHGDSEPLSASDADVAVIAHHAARIAVDSLLPESESAFPYSFYLVGLMKGWVFTQPFATIPLPMSTLPRSPSASVNPVLTKETLQFLSDLLDRSGPK